MIHRSDSTDENWYRLPISTYCCIKCSSTIIRLTRTFPPNCRLLTKRKGESSSDNPLWHHVTNLDMKITSFLDQQMAIIPQPYFHHSLFLNHESFIRQTLTIESRTKLWTYTNTFNWQTHWLSLYVCTQMVYFYGLLLSFNLTVMEIHQHSHNLTK